MGGKGKRESKGREGDLLIRRGGSGVREEREGKGVNGRDKVKAKGTVSPQNLKTEIRQCVCVRMCAAETNRI